MILGDCNAKLGTNQANNWPETDGQHGVGIYNEGLQCLHFCAIHSMKICNTILSTRTSKNIPGHPLREEHVTVGLCYPMLQIQFPLDWADG